MENQDLITITECNKQDQEVKDACNKKSDITMCNPTLARAIAPQIGGSTMVVLKANQLNILNQVFRPIFVGRITEVNEEFIRMENVNIKMNQASEYVFPTPLLIPLNKIAWYTPFDPAVRISLY